MPERKSVNQLLKDANEILRSFHAVIERKGDKTNWDALKVQVEKALQEQQPALYDIEEIILSGNKI